MLCVVENTHVFKRPLVSNTVTFFREMVFDRLLAAGKRNVLLTALSHIFVV